MAEQMIKVRSGLEKKKDGGEPIALSEYDKRHPDGYGFVASTTKAVEVYPTPKVRELVTKGTLIEGDDPNAPAEEKPETPETPEIREGDTPEKLSKRYNKEQLLQLAKDNDVTISDPKATNLVIAETILSRGQ